MTFDEGRVMTVYNKPAVLAQLNSLRLIAFVCRLHQIEHNNGFI
jgi:hypothetical protein